MNIEITIILPIVAAVAAMILRHMFRHVFIVPEGYAGLLYHYGKFAAQIGVGRHIRWGRGFTLTHQDLRKAILAVTGQEVLSADNVCLKASLSVSYQVVDPVKALHDAQNWAADLHNQVQLALRAVVGDLAVEPLVTQRASVAAKLLALVQPAAAKFGVQVHAVELKDLMYPAELKRAFAEALKARQEGQAALERARGESAALRNLANAARVLEGNPELLNLRLLQSIASAQAAGNTLVLGIPTGFVPLKNGKGSPGPTASSEP
ncbi:MAG: slipin family protein [Verrucomicrobia bacterium]|nr:slipin family protein [Verrucomicrobiota bacterium]